MARRFAVCLALVASVVLAACGGGTAAPTGTAGSLGGGTSRPVATAGGGGAAGGGGGAATAATTAQAGAGGGSAALDDPCALLTVDEAGGALGSDPLTASGTAGDPATCRYVLAEGDEAMWVTILRNGAATQFQSFIDNGSTEDVSGVGDAAIYERGTSRVLVRVGDLLVIIYTRYIQTEPLAAMTAMARIIVARLTTGSVPPELQITAPPIIAVERACELLTVAEAENVLKLGALTTQANEFTPQFCTYAIASGEVVVSTFLQRKGGIADWPGYESSMTTDPVPGLGDKAMFEPASGILLVLRGDTIVNVNVFGQDAAATLDLDRRLAEIMLTHL